MSDLIQAVKDGVVQQKKASNTEKKNELDRDAFLQLLTTQMKYQDPLNPNTDTEYVAQLATFSQLEQLQNLSSVTTNTQAFSLVGKEVMIRTENVTGKETYVSGRVDFVSMNGTKTQLSINGNLYSIDQLDSVIDNTYIIEQGLPKIPEKLELKYDGANPKDITFEVNLGSGDTIANDVAVIVNDFVINTDLVNVKGNVVTVDKSAFSIFGNGVHKVTIAFNDSMLTQVKDMVTLKVQNAVNPTEDNTGTQEDNSTKESEKTDTTA